MTFSSNVMTTEAPVVALPLQVLQRYNIFEDNIHPIICTIPGEETTITGKFSSPYEASILLGVAQVGIINCLKLKQKTAFGFLWRYDTEASPYATCHRSFTSQAEILQYKKIFEADAVIALECLSKGEDHDEMVLRRFDSVKDASQAIQCLYGVPTEKVKLLIKEIYHCCEGKLPLAFGLRWRYFDSSSAKCKLRDTTDTELITLLQLPPTLEHKLAPI